MKIYLAGSISGGRKFAKNIKVIAEALQELGHEVISPFVVDMDVNESRYPEFSGKELAKAHFEEDLDLVLNKADAVVAEVSQPSHGVGVEIGAITAKKMLKGGKTPTLLLVDDSLKGKKISKLILGNPHAEVKYYNRENIKGVLESFFRKNKK